MTRAASYFFNALKRTTRSTIKGRPERACYDPAVVYGIIDEAIYCHAGFVLEGRPYVIPTVHARVADQLYIHGSAASRMLRSLGRNIPACVTITLLDGAVLARSAFHHSLNYRSVVIVGVATEVLNRSEKLSSLQAIVEHVVPGRWADARGPNEQEIKATKILRIPIEEASAKLRTGPPIDEEEDYRLTCWAGEIPLKFVPDEPVPDPRLQAGIALPEYVRYYRRGLRSRS